MFVQWKKPTDPSRFVIDGEVSDYSGTEEQDEIMKLFANVPKYKEICSNKKRNHLSPSFRCSYEKIKTKTKTSILYFVEGNFEETDYSGRKLVYIFATIENESDKIVRTLKEYASLLGVTPHLEDLEEIKKNEIKKQPKIKYLCLSIIIVFSLLLFMLLNLLNKQ